MQRRPPVTGRRESDLVPRVVPEHAVRRPRRRSREPVGGGRPHPLRVGADLVEDGPGQPEPRASAPARWRGRSRPARRPSPAGRPPCATSRVQVGCAELVVDDVEGLPARLQGGHRPDEVAAVLAVEPGGAHDVGRVGQQRRAPPSRRRPWSGRTPTPGPAARPRRTAWSPSRRRRSRSRPGPAGTPCAAQAAASSCGPSPLTRVASASCASAPSTSVQAAALTTTSCPGTRLGDRSRVGDVELARG